MGNVAPPRSLSGSDDPHPYGIATVDHMTNYVDVHHAPGYKVAIGEKASKEEARRCATAALAEAEREVDAQFVAVAEAETALGTAQARLRTCVKRLGDARVTLDLRRSAVARLYGFEAARFPDDEAGAVPSDEEG